MASDQYRELSKEEKDGKSKYARNRQQNISEEDKQKLRERKKNRICVMSQDEL